MIPKHLLPLAVTAAVVIPTVQAQNAEQPAIRDTDESGLETIVVTGVASAGGVKKLEASYNIVTASEAEIRRANPKSAADLLKINPHTLRSKMRKLGLDWRRFRNNEA